MNERIKELRQKAIDFANETTSSNNVKAWDIVCDTKFAELIVQECAGVTLDYKNDEYYTGWCDHAEEILKHFGVEE